MNTSRSKSIYTLIADVKQFLASQQEHDIPILVHYGERKEPPALRLSKMGEICPRHLWFSIHHPELAEPMPAEALFKFSFGHTIEAQAISLAKASGHEVTGEQDELVVSDIKGHRDCVIDGHVVDVKSCSSRMFEKFERKTIGNLPSPEDPDGGDPFGYLAQLDGYLVGSAEDPLVYVKDTGFIWAIDKTLGKMVLYEHKVRRDLILRRIELHKRIIQASTPPSCTCRTVKHGESGNLKLGTKASYSPFKRQCFPHLRTFLYKGRNGQLEPVHLAKVVRTPDVLEVFGRMDRERTYGQSQPSYQYVSDKGIGSVPQMPEAHQDF